MGQAGEGEPELDGEVEVDVEEGFMVDACSSNPLIAIAVGLVLIEALQPLSVRL